MIPPYWSNNMTEQSFGEYFDAQRDRLRKMMEKKDAKQHLEWEEEYNKRKKDLTFTKDKV